MNEEKTRRVKTLLMTMNKVLAMSIEDLTGEEAMPIVIVCSVGGQVQVASNVSKDDMAEFLGIIAEQAQNNEQVQEEHFKAETKQ
jgi:hypothetical protein